MQITLDTTYIYLGKFYGPGPVDVPDDVGETLQARMDALSASARLQDVNVPQGDLAADLAAGGSSIDPLAPFPELTAAGYDLERVRAASDTELLDLPGIGKATLKRIRAATTE